MARAYQPKRHSLKPQSSVDVAELLAAREDICNVVKTSSGSSRVNTACAVNKVQDANYASTYKKIKIKYFKLTGDIHRDVWLP